MSQSDNAIDMQFHRKEGNMLEVLSILLSGAILPFIHYFEEQMRDTEFYRFKQFATTNANIFWDFTRYLVKHYIFNSNSNVLTKGKKGKKTV